MGKIKPANNIQTGNNSPVTITINNYGIQPVANPQNLNSNKSKWDWIMSLLNLAGGLFKFLSAS